MKKFIIGFITLFSVTSLFANKIIVTSSIDSGIGTLREAVTNADNGDTIVFSDNVTIVSLSTMIRLEKNITIIGNEDNNTVISFTGSTGRHFCQNQPVATVFLNNLTFKNGRVPNSCGGSIYILAGNTLTLNNCVFYNNTAIEGSGGAINNSYGNITINNCFFENNRANAGAAIVNGGEMSINNSTFINNNGLGGAVENLPTPSIITITNCIFKENKGGIAGAFWNRGTATIVNCFFSLNQCEPIYKNTVWNCGIIYNSVVNVNERGGISLTVVNSTIVDNANENGIYNDAQATIQNSIIWNNDNDVHTGNEGTTTASYNLIGTSNTDLTGNNNIINENPLFVGGGDYSLQEGSPAIDKGNNSYLPAGIAIDLAGAPRINNGIVDIGCYEYQQDIVDSVDTILSDETEKTVIGYCNIMGQKLPKEPKNGFYIILYNDGTAKKVIGK